MLNSYSMTLYVSLAYTASLILQAKDCVTQVVTLAYLCVCSQAPIQLPVGTADGKLSKEGLEMRLCSTCSYTPHPFINTNRKITQLQTRSELYNPFPPPQLPQIYTFHTDCHSSLILYLLLLFTLICCLLSEFITVQNFS